MIIMCRKISFRVKFYCQIRPRSYKIVNKNGYQRYEVMALSHSPTPVEGYNSYEWEGSEIGAD